MTIKYWNKASSEDSITFSIEFNGENGSNAINQLFYTKKNYRETAWINYFASSVIISLKN